MKAVTLIFVLLSLVQMAIAQGMTQTADGAYVLQPTIQKKGDAPAVGAQAVKFDTNAEGHVLRLYFQWDAVDERLGDFSLNPWLEGEDNYRTTPFNVKRVGEVYEFTDPILFKVENGKLFFAKKKVESFEVFRLRNQASD